ncbi:MAG: BolA family protein [Deltaproteobacteria bacterium]|nr:BolA family protein [Deltaproteobacteria bacterium]
MSALGNTIEQKLTAALGATSVVVTDDSADHAGHGASGAHVSVVVVAEAFRGKGALARHRMVYAALAEELKGSSAPIHALAIVAKVPGE